MTSLSLGHMREAGQKILEKFEDLSDIRFVKFEGAVDSFPVVFAEIKVESIKVWNAAIHTLDHLVLEVEKSGVVERDPNVAGESRSRVVTHWPETKLKSVGL